MARKLSAGLLLYRHANQDDEIVLEVLLGLMSGPFWALKTKVHGPYPWRV